MSAAAFVVVVGGCAALVIVPQRNAVESLDPATNTRTGLPDGHYLMAANASFHQDDRCWFRGKVIGAQVSATDPPEVTVYGTGPLPCAGAADGQVNFMVTNGVATVTDSSP